MIGQSVIRRAVIVRTVVAVAAASTALLASTAELGAQVEASPVLSGLVQRAGEPLGDVPVVLHRVDAAEAGALDTLVAATDGTFRFGLPSVPDPGGRGEIYFASVDHQGVLYFGPPVATAAELDSLYRIEVFDTLTAPPGGAAIPVSVRYLLVEPMQAGWSVTDLVELEVTGDRTLVPADSTSPTWRYLLPSGVGEVQVGGGDIAPVSTVFAGDTVSVSMPLTPGPRQLVLRYFLDSLSLEVPLPGTTGELELLVREPTPTIEVAGLVAVEPVELEPGVIYRRYAAAMLTDSAVTLRATDEGGSPAIPLEVLIVLIGLGLTAVGVWAVRRAPAAGVAASASGTAASGGRSAASGSGPASPAPEGPAERSRAALGPEARERLVLSIARIDERLEKTNDPGEAASLRAERDALMSRLRDG